MSVEVSFLTVAMRKASVRRLPTKAFEALLRLFNWQPDWTREDEHLVATSFMAPADVRAFGALLQGRLGLKRGLDWAVVDMSLGPTEPAPWLTFQGGMGQECLAWLASEPQGTLARARRLVPGRDFPADQLPRLVKLFGRDNNHDAEGHLEDFGRLIPAWGGRDLWCVACPGPGNGGADLRYLSFEIGPQALEGLFTGADQSRSSVGGSR